MEDTKTSTNTSKDIYLIFIGLLPLGAVIALFHFPTNWQVIASLAADESLGSFLYVFLTFCGLFISGIFGLLFVQVTPYPKSRLAGLFMLLDAPLQLALASVLGNPMTIDQLLITDFVVEIAGFVIALLLLLLLYRKSISAENKSSHVLLVVLGILLVSGIYGYLVVGWFSNLSFINQLPLYTGILSTVLLYLFTVKSQNETNTEIKSKGLPAYIAIGVMFICWGYLVAGIIMVNT